VKGGLPACSKYAALAGRLVPVTDAGAGFIFSHAHTRANAGRRAEASCSSGVIFIEFGTFLANCCRGAAEMQLRSASLERLVGLRDKVETVLKKRIGGARSELESRLKEPSDFGGAKRTSRRGVRGGVSPKYRNPDNSGETWTGRGLLPRWLAAELKRGAPLEDFLIEGAPRRRRKTAAGVRMQRQGGSKHGRSNQGRRAKRTSRAKERCVARPRNR
jgi:DNA-binding protein H-NS